MKKIGALVAFGAALCAGAAFADTMQNGYGNTFVVTNAEGAAFHYQFNADGGFTASTPAGEQVAAGTYEVANGELCITPTGGERGCTPYIGDKNVGDTWTQNGTDGAPVTITLQAGH